jgi:lysophospholipase L1-like esterase
VYLWHLPVVAFMPTLVLIEQPALRGMVQAGLILALAAASFRLLEDPIRRRLPAARAGGRSGLAIRAVMLVPAATLTLAVWPLIFSTPTEFEAHAAEPDPMSESAESEAAEAESSEPQAAETAKPEPTSLAEVKAPDAVLTSCQAVAHVGDSTSIGLVSKYFLPKVDDQIAARYRGVGVGRFWNEISTARSMVETYKDSPNATQVVKRRRAGGYRGCWVMALGTNDPANTNGDVAKLSARIDAMMAQLGGVPVLWTTTKTLKEKGPYRNANMAGWNEALTKACARHSNMRVYDWATEVQDDWFLHDGIHFNTPGYKERAARIAKALALAFPRGGSPAKDCFVRTTAP